MQGDEVIPTGRVRVGVSEAIADRLRSRLLSGDYREGDELPKQDRLMSEYGVSKAAVREALRILETEGLVEIRRGSIGGALVRLPEPAGAAYTLALVLQARRVAFADVGVALRQVEPACAGLCAARPDRARAVLPRLRIAQRDLRRAIKRDDDTGTLSATRDFHEALVGSCGNETLIILAGTLEALWTLNAQQTNISAAAAGDSQSPALRQETAEAHEEIYEYIAEGEVDLTMKAARLHLSTGRLHARRTAADVAVEATAVRDHYLRTRNFRNIATDRSTS